MANNALSFAAEIINPSKRERECFQASLDTYQDAINWLVPIANQHWDQIQQGEKSTDKRGILEQLVHKTKTNPTPPHGEFDTLYPNMPSYFRRAALTAAIGDISSWRSNHQRWTDEGKYGDEPKLASKYHQAPAFYKTNMWKTITIGYKEQPDDRLPDKHLTTEEQTAKAKARQERTTEATQRHEEQGERRNRYAKYRKPHHPDKVKAKGEDEGKQADEPATKKRDWGEKGDEDFTRCLIKVRSGGDWAWIVVHLRPDHAWKLKRMSGLMKRSAPVLERRGRK